MSNIIFKDGVNFNRVNPVLKNIFDEYDRRGVRFRVTEGFAESGHTSGSKHYSGNAVDITPVEGDDFETLNLMLGAHPDLLDRLKAGGFSLLDESRGGGKEWTGAHYHIGTDSRVPITNWDKLTVKEYNRKMDALSTNANIALQHLTQRGLTPEVASGIIGNLMQESGSALNTSALNKKEGAFGIAQWRNDRRTGLTNFATSNQLSETDLTTQLDYILHELQTTEKRAYDRLMKATTVEEATDAFNTYYERSADKKGTTGFSKRLTNANLVYNSISGEQRPFFEVGNSNTNLASTRNNTVDGQVDNAVSNSLNYISETTENIAEALKERNEIDRNQALADSEQRKALQKQQEQEALLAQVMANTGLNIVNSEKI